MNDRRDLLYVKKACLFNLAPPEADIEFLHRLLSYTETVRNLSACTEVADLNRLTIIRQPYLIQQVLHNGSLKPFCFLINRN